MTTLNLNITDADVENLNGSEIKAHIAAITGQPEKKIARKQDGLVTLRRLRMWARNEDGLLGVPKDSKPVVRSYVDLQAKARERGKTLGDLPRANDKIVPIDPEWDEPADIVDGDAAIAQSESETVPVVTVNDLCNTPVGHIPEEVMNEFADANQAMETVPEFQDGPQEPEEQQAANEFWAAMGDGREYERGSLRERLARQARVAAPIVEKKHPRYIPKKITGEPRKPREQLLGVKATFNGLTKNHKGGMRDNLLGFCQSLVNRPVEGWPVGSVSVSEIESHFDQNCRQLLHKLIEDGHLSRVVPNAMLPRQSVRVTETV